MANSTQGRYSSNQVVMVSRAWTSIVVLATISGCSWLGDAPIEDLGSTAEGPVESVPAPDRDPGALDPGFAGRWEGYAEDPFQLGEDGRPLPTRFPSGSTSVTLDYRFLGVSLPAATLVFGAGPAPVPMPGVSYPPGFHHYYAAFFDANFKAPVVEGFEYELSERSLRVDNPDNASLLATPRHAAYDEWCALQTPLPEGDGDFNCAGISSASGGDPLLEEGCVVRVADGTEKAINCDLAALCTTDLCRCDASHCALDSDEPMQVYLQRFGDDIIATVSGAAIESDQLGWYAPLGTLRLHRVAD